MKRILLIPVLLLAAHFTYASEEECPAAVDVAEAQNHNVYKHCDYSKSGLNGVLHRTLSTKEKKQTEEESHEDASISSSVQQSQDKGQTIGQNTGEFSSAQQLQSAKYILLEDLKLTCPKGFIIEGERYVPVRSNNAMKLELLHRCL